MPETGSEKGSEGRKEFFRRHWKIFSLFIVGVILASVGVILVFLWFVGDAQLTGKVPTTLGLWTIGNLAAFLINLVFWEVLLIGIPVILSAAVDWLWWKKRTPEERKQYRLFGARSRASRGGNAVSLLVLIAFCIKIYLDGNWNLAFSAWTFDYLVYSILAALIWVLIIIGIPIALGIIWWISHERRMTP
jgi:hypothetical protein